MKNLDVTMFLVSIGNCTGVGCLVGNKLVTAGHVVELCPDPCYYHDGTHEIHKENAEVYSYMFDETLSSEGSDVAIFEQDACNSPIEFSKEIPSVGDVLECATIQIVHKRDDRPNIPELFREQSELVSKTCKVTVTEVEGDFLGCQTDCILGKGNSGSPLLLNGKVVGVLIAGEPGTTKCVFQLLKDKVN